MMIGTCSCGKQYKKLSKFHTMCNSCKKQSSESVRLFNVGSNTCLSSKVKKVTKE